MFCSQEKDLSTSFINLAYNAILNFLVAYP